MTIECAKQWDPDSVSEVLVLGVPSDWKNSESVRQVDAKTSGWLVRLIEAEELSTKPTKTTVLLSPPGLAARQLVLVGLGDLPLYEPGVAYRAAGAAAKVVASKARKIVTFIGFEGSEMARSSALIGAINGFQGQDLLRKEKSLFQPESIRWIDIQPESLTQAVILADCILEMRRLVNLPPNILDPIAFVNEATTLCKDLPIEMEVWDEPRLRAERCNAMLAVAQGSTKPPRLIMFRYRGNGNGPPVALVGKGVTFDSGGLSIKPTDSMLTMKMDMAGAATVLAIVKAAAQLKLDQPILGIVGMVENMIGGNCMRLGDVLKSRNGKTIEMHNTDAEGRMVLADLLDVAVENKPKSIVDFATLTGACLVALGTDINGIMGNNPAMEAELRKAAETAGELVWPLPMHPFFSEQIVGKVGDLKNMGDGRWGGATIAAKFLEEFVDKTPWVHFDIAGPAFLETAKPWQDLGATGTLVRTTIEWLRNQNT